LAFSIGGIHILKEWIFKVGGKRWKLAYKSAPTTLKMKKKNTPGLRFIFFGSGSAGRISAAIKKLRRICLPSGVSADSG